MWSTPAMSPLAIGRRRAQHDDEQDRLLGQLEQQDGEREPGDRRHGLQAGDQRADGGAQHRDPRDQRADDRADDDGDGEADDGPPHRDEHRLARTCRRRAQLATARRSTATGAGQHVLRLPARPDDELPDEQGRCRRPRAWARSPTRAAGHARRRSAARRDRGRPVASRPASSASSRASRSAQASAWRRTSSRSRSVIVGGQLGRPRATRSGGAGRCRRRTRPTTRPGRLVEQHDAVGEPGRLPHVVGHEQHGEVALAPERLELVVEQVAGHGVERAERLVHEQDVGVLGEGPGQGDPLAHAARQLVGRACAEAVEVHRRRSSSSARSPASRPAARPAAAGPARRCRRP